LWLAHLARVFISQTHGHQNIIRNPAHLKLDLDAFVFPLPFNRTFPRSFGGYGYSGLRAHLYSLPKDEIRIAAYDSLSVMDYICQLLKLLHMAV
jgi:hypothetical protein